MKRFLIICMLMSPLMVVAQLTDRNKTEKITGALEGDADWGEGSVLLGDGTELKGMVKYNDRTSIVSFESGATSASYNAGRLTGFEVYDNRISKQRIFFSLPYESPDNNVVTNQFFEVVRQFTDFAVLVKVDPIDVVREKRELGHTPTLLNPKRSVVIREKMRVVQIETLYFLQDDPQLRPYIRYVDRNVTDADLFLRGDDSDVKTKYHDKDLIEKLTGTYYKELRKYAKANKLAFDEKEDILKILDHYELISNP